MVEARGFYPYTWGVQLEPSEKQRESMPWQCWDLGDRGRENGSGPGGEGKKKLLGSGGEERD